MKRLIAITTALLAMALPVVAYAAQPASPRGCRSPKSYIKDLRISTNRSGDTNRCFVAGFVAEKAPFVNGRHFRLAGNYYTDGDWYISKYTNLPHGSHQSRLGFTVRQTTGLGTPIGRTVVTFILQTAAG
jgi:hypothetical protein